MRSTQRNSLLIGLICAAVATWTCAGEWAGPGRAEAQPKPKKDQKKDQPKPATPSDQPVEEGEIEMGGEEDEKPAGPATGVDEGEIEMDPEEGGKEPSLEADTASTEAESERAVKASTAKLAGGRLSWQDIVVVVRKPFLKVRRAELLPFVATTMNDNIIRHFSAGAQANYYVTDVLAFGIEGQYFQYQYREPFDLVARQARRLPTVNKYNWSAVVNFHYVPVYGKFAVLDKHIITWESFITAGVGVTQSEVLPRDTTFPGFTNYLVTPHVGASMRFFLFKWLTVSFAVRDYMFVDQYEPTNRTADMNASAADAKKNADPSFINNVMFQIGASFWLPTSFEYTTFR